MYLHFNKKTRNFQQHAEFTLIEQIKKQKPRTRTALKLTEYLWVLKLKALYPDGLDQELNNTDEQGTPSSSSTVNLYSMTKSQQAVMITKT